MTERQRVAAIGGVQLGCAVVISIVLSVAGCDVPEPDGPDVDSTSDAVGGPPVCPDGPPTPAVSVETGLATLGAASRAPRRAGDWLFVVQSSSNTVGRYELDSGDYARDFIDVGSDHNPYGLAIDASESRAWITNWLADSVSVADTARGKLVDEVTDPAFDRPADVALTDDLAFVVNTAFEGDGTYGQGTLTAVDRATRTVHSSAATRWKNPQYLRPIRTPSGRRLAVVDSGSISTGGEAQSAAGLELWPLSDDLSTRRRSTYPLGIDRDENLGAPGRPLPIPSQPHLYVTSATAPVLFKFDLAERRWVRGIDDPIRLYDSGEKSLNRGAVGPRGIVYVAAFNRDAVYAFDPTCDRLLAGPVELDVNPNQPDGPIGLVPVARDDHTDLYVTQSLANRIDRVRFRFDTTTSRSEDPDVRSGE